MKFRFIEVDEIMGAELNAMHTAGLDHKVYDESLDRIKKLADIQNGMVDRDLKERQEERMKQKDEKELELRQKESEDKQSIALKELELKLKQFEAEHEIKLKEVDIRMAQVELERLKSDREFELKMRELDERAEDKKFDWQQFMMDAGDKIGIAGLLAMILHYEKFEVVTSKALQVVLKLIRLRH